MAFFWKIYLGVGPIESVLQICFCTFNVNPAAGAQNNYLIFRKFTDMQAEKWVNNMSKAAEDELTEVEGRPSRLG